MNTIRNRLVSTVGTITIVFPLLVGLYVSIWHQEPVGLLLSGYFLVFGLMTGFVVAVLWVAMIGAPLLIVKEKLLLRRSLFVLLSALCTAVASQFLATQFPLGRDAGMFENNNAFIFGAALLGAIGAISVSLSKD